MWPGQWSCLDSNTCLLSCRHQYVLPSQSTSCSRSKPVSFSTGVPYFLGIHCFNTLKPKERSLKWLSLEHWHSCQVGYNLRQLAVLATWSSDTLPEVSRAGGIAQGGILTSPAHRGGNPESTVNLEAGQGHPAQLYPGPSSRRAADVGGQDGTSSVAGRPQAPVGALVWESKVRPCFDSCLREEGFSGESAQQGIHRN